MGSNNNPENNNRLTPRERQASMSGGRQPRDESIYDGPPRPGPVIGEMDGTRQDPPGFANRYGPPTDPSLIADYAEGKDSVTVIVPDSTITNSMSGNEFEVFMTEEQRFNLNVALGAIEVGPIAVSGGQQASVSRELLEQQAASGASLADFLADQTSIQIDDQIVYLSQTQIDALQLSSRPIAQNDLGRVTAFATDALIEEFQVENGVQTVMLNGKFNIHEIAAQIPGEGGNNIDGAAQRDFLDKVVDLNPNINSFEDLGRFGKGDVVILPASFAGAKIDYSDLADVKGPVKHVGKDVAVPEYEIGGPGFGDLKQGPVLVAGPNGELVEQARDDGEHQGVQTRPNFEIPIIAQQSEWGGARTEAGELIASSGEPHPYKDDRAEMLEAYQNAKGPVTVAELAAAQAAGKASLIGEKFEELHSAREGFLRGERLEAAEAGNMQAMLRTGGNDKASNELTGEQAAKSGGLGGFAHLDLSGVALAGAGFDTVNMSGGVGNTEPSLTTNAEHVAEVRAAAKDDSRNV